MALHYHFEGADDGLALWISFSEDSEKFKLRELKTQWQSFKDAANPVTVGTLIKGAPNWAKARQDAETFAIAGEILNEYDPNDADLLPAKIRGKHKSLMVDGKGRRLNNLANAAHWLRSNEAFGGLLCFDEMNMEAVIRQTSGKIMPLMDHQITALTETLQRDGIKEISSAKVAESANLVAHENSFHPLRDWLRGLVWDGRKRLSTWLPDYLGTADTEYTQAIGRMFLISMVARVMQPGAKVDHMMILQGEQGVGKSTVARILAGTEYFSDDLPAMNAGKDLLQHLRGKWLIEVAELDKMRLADVNATKAFLTKSEDRFRAPYARVEETHPRQCVFFGTTNEDQYLRDATGARRFWPVMVGDIDLKGVKKSRDQFFAEAISAFNAGENWWPDRKFEQEVIKPRQDSKYIADIWTDSVSDWIEQYEETRFSLEEVLRVALGTDIGRAGMVEQKRLGIVLRKLGCEQLKTGGRKVWITCKDSAHSDVRGA